MKFNIICYFEQVWLEIPRGCTATFTQDTGMVNFAENPNVCLLVPTAPSPPQSPTPSTSSLHPPETVRIPPQHHTQSQLTSELIGIIKTASEALQSIVQVAEKLIRQVNASRRLAHRPQKFGRSPREDAPGNVGCSSPPTFPSGRRVL